MSKRVRFDKDAKREAIAAPGVKVTKQAAPPVAKAPPARPVPKAPEPKEDGE